MKSPGPSPRVNKAGVGDDDPTLIKPMEIH